MNTEDSEFERIEAEAKRRAAQDDDDTQSYTSETYRCGFEAGAAAEREACAKVCDEINNDYDGEEVSASWIATAIRARGTS